MKHTHAVAILLVLLLLPCCRQAAIHTQPSEHDLVFPDLAASWDEGMPLGNATVGALVWQKENKLRLSLDRVDLWDLRPMENRDDEKFSFDWVKEHVRKKDYKPVQKAFDEPYDRQPAPSKIPGAALEFDLGGMGKVEQTRLYLNNAVCEVRWQNGAVMHTFVHAVQPLGRFVIEGASDTFIPELVPPVYDQSNKGTNNEPVSGLALSRLGYKQGTISKEKNKIVYHQIGWGGFYYDAAVKWERKGTRLTGVWSLTSSLGSQKASQLVDEALANQAETQYAAHLDWWNAYWSKSSIHIPDSLLEKQYYNEMYKFGSATRSDSYPISLQAVWTADNGNLPPWKGDYHHDLNTQLSYWPAYTGNHLEEGMGYLNTLWKQRNTHRQYTKDYFGTGGINVPGVCTLTGEPMGGWIQYAFSPTVSAWLAQHFYLHWKYSADTRFLKERAYPYIKDAAAYLEEITVMKNAYRTLPISSSPEIYDNSLKAWFTDISNYDLALVSFAFKAAAETAAALDLPHEADHWKALRNQLPDFSTDSLGALNFAPGHPYKSSHRHLSHQMAVHPLGLIDQSNGEHDRRIIKATIDKLDKAGPGAWTGYTYSWLGNIKARALDGDGAAKALHDFATCFCLRNTFHVNGDQSGTGKSGFTYRPFTLEGNFAFASGIQEMLLQSHTGIIHVFPAIPQSWKQLGFDRLRAQGAFLVSAEREGGKTTEIKITALKGGILKLKNPFENEDFHADNTNYSINNTIITMATKAGETITFKL